MFSLIRKIYQSFAFYLPGVLECPEIQDISKKLKKSGNFRTSLKLARISGIEIKLDLI